MTQVELYARGLALAEGYAEKGKTSLVYHMSPEAYGVLRMVGNACGSKNGLREQSTQRSGKLSLQGKGWWKFSVEGLDAVHAFRGYVEGDGCWSRSFTTEFYKGKKTRYWYPCLVILSKRNDLVNKWIKRCLEVNKVKYFNQYRLQTGRTCELLVWHIKGTQAEKLHRILYKDSLIDFKKGRLYPRRTEVIQERK